MNFDFVLPMMKWRCETSPDTVHLFGGSRFYGDLQLPWADIVQAGISPREPIKAPKGAPIEAVLPMGKKLLSMTQELSAKTNYFYIAFQQGSRRKIRTYAVPKDGPDLDRFVREWRQRLGQRWSDESVSLLKVRKQLGISNWWVWPVAGLFALLAAVLGFTFLAIKSAVPPLIGLAFGLAVWTWREYLKT